MDDVEKKPSIPCKKKTSHTTGFSRTSANRRTKLYFVDTKVISIVYDATKRRSKQNGGHHVSLSITWTIYTTYIFYTTINTITSFGNNVRTGAPFLFFLCWCCKYKHRPPLVNILYLQKYVLPSFVFPTVPKLYQDDSNIFRLVMQPVVNPKSHNLIYLIWKSDHKYMWKCETVWKYYLLSASIQTIASIRILKRTTRNHTKEQVSSMKSSTLIFVHQNVKRY